MGDPGKIFLLEAFLKVLKSDNLLDQVNRTGRKLKSELHEIEKEFPNHLNSTRGRGTFLAINVETSKLRDDILARLKKKGENYCVKILIMLMIIQFNELYYNTIFFSSENRRVYDTLPNR